MRLIDADDAVARLENFEDQNDSLLSALTDEEQAIAFCVYCKVVGALEKMPTIDAVPVVRCENCQYWQPPTYQEQEDGSTVGHCTAALNGQQTDAYWFCADGTR